MKKSKRKVFLINPSFQLKIILFFSVTFIISQTTIFISINYFFEKIKLQGVDSGLPTDHVFFKFINEQQNDINLLLSGVSVILLLLFVIGGYELSRKIAGPLYRLTRDVCKVNKETDFEIKFRKGDFFTEVAVAVNDLIKRLK